LSLIGVALSVAALASVVGLANLARDSMVASSERSGGRSATLTVFVNAPGPADTEKVRAAFDGLVARHDISYSSVYSQQQQGFQFPGGVQEVQLAIVDQGYGTIQRVDVSQGGWFAPDDGARLAPAVVVSQSFYDAAGRPDLVTAPQVQLTGDSGATAVVIGVVPDQYPNMPPQAYILRQGAEAAGITANTAQGSPPELKIWVQPAMADQLTGALSRELQQQLPGLGVHVQRTDYAAYGDPFAQGQLMTMGVAGLVLLLGAVGLLNISMVTVRYRVREIGIRRSFGATSARVFFSVLMESVVATTAAGAVGVMLAVAVVKNPRIEHKIAPMLSEYPPFPLEAALLGLGAAVLVGALAGAIPALVAVRVKVIDAIRF
ncbi:MAG TPA: ABC transporter permease, partial [Micrococcaceae bacterium]